VDRPENVPADWVLVDCTNPTCEYTVWVPPHIQVTIVDDLSGAKLPVLPICSAKCSMELLDAMRREVQDARR
jgi:hypothetical protein